MELREVAAFQNALNDPIKAMVSGLAAGYALENEQDLQRAEGFIRTIKEEYIPGLREQMKENSRYIGGFKESKDGQDIQKRISTYEQWIKALEKGIKDGTKSIADKAQESEKAQIDKARERAHQAKAALDGFDDSAARTLIHLAKLIKHQPLDEALHPLFRARQNFRMAVNQLKSLGVHEYEPLDREVEEAYAAITGNVFKKKRHGG